MTNIYVGNLSFRQTEEELRASFEAYGAVTSVKIVKDRETGRSRGFAFVEMPNADEAHQAIEGLNNQSAIGIKEVVGLRKALTNCVAVTEVKECVECAEDEFERVADFGARKFLCHRCHISTNADD